MLTLYQFTGILHDTSRFETIVIIARTYSDAKEKAVTIAHSLHESAERREFNHKLIPPRKIK